jgi:hypothetical protein
VRPFRQRPWFLLLALLALAAQIVVPFIHAHVHGPLALGYYLAAAHGKCLAPVPGSSAPASCPDHESDCPVCAAISAVSSFTLPAPVAVLTPVSHGRSDAPLEWSSERPNNAPLTYQARAPPARIEA